MTALFKHPLGIPIPHTAIIKRKKDQLGEGLGTFVRENFLSPPVVETKLRDAQIPSRLGKWLSEATHAQRVAAETATVLRVLVELLRDEDIQQVIDRMIVRRIAEPQWGRRRAGCWRRCWPRIGRKPLSNCWPIGRSSGRSTPGW